MNKKQSLPYHSQQRPISHQPLPLQEAPPMADVLPVHIGILGCAEIARKVCRAITLAPNATLAAVASRSLEKAKSFAELNRFPASVKIHGSYDSLLADTDVDALYMPLPTSLHMEWAIKAAEKGKHLLLEKPVALNVAEFDRILEACEENGVQIMDGTMWMHHLRMKKMKEFLSDPERFGKLETVHSRFTFAASEDFLKNDIRVKPDLDALGALGDIGWYTIRISLLANNFELPKTVTALPGPVLNQAGVILSCGASLYWEDGKVATIHCSFFGNLTMDFTATGTNGTLHVHDFNIPFQETEASFTTTTRASFSELATGWTLRPSEHKVMMDVPQEACMVSEFARLVGDIKRKGSKPDKWWPTISRKTQLVLDAVKLSIEQGLKPIDIAS